MEIVQLGDVSEDINQENVWDGDLLDRKRIADGLTGLITGQERPLRLAVDGGWGTGKTYLLKRWHYELVRDGHLAIYYNAWEDDFISDPLLAILATLAKYLAEVLPEEDADGVVKEVVKKGIATARASWVPVLLSALKKGTGLDLSKVAEELEKQYSKRVAEDYGAEVQGREDFRKELSRLVESCIGDGEEEGAKKGPLVFIIDELDRCRPTYAIELLERIKHVFSIDKVVFVFGIDRKQLENAIGAVYGEKFDAGKYLQRFIHQPVVELPQVEAARFLQHQLRTRLDSLVATVPWDEYASASCSYFGLSLREIEQCLQVWGRVAKKGGEENKVHAPFTLWSLVCIRCSHPEIYEGLKSGNMTVREALRKIAGEGQDSPRKGGLRGRAYVDFMTTFYASLYALKLQGFNEDSARTYEGREFFALARELAQKESGGTLDRMKEYFPPLVAWEVRAIATGQSESSMWGNLAHDMVETLKTSTGGKGKFTMSEEFFWKLLEPDISFEG